MEYKIGFYLRLSSEDKNIGESNSILNQRKILENYVSLNTEFNHCSIVEYSDDGYSGATFQRPEMINLLEDIKKGKINCVIVKDFSRFGRNYIDVLDYIEQIFPFLGVRFISVNDKFDSNNFTGTTGGLDVAFKQLLNDLYLKDLSVKIKSVLRNKSEKGEYLPPYPFYGYKKSEADRTKIEIDKESSDVVKFIFDLAVEGKNNREIALILNDKKIPTKRQYQDMKHPNMKYKFKNNYPCWSKATVGIVIRDERYTGTLISGKHEPLEIGSRKRKILPKDKWVVIPNNHEAIVSKEIFRKAQRPKQTGEKGKNTKLQKHDYLFMGKVFCGNCGTLLRRKPYVGGDRYSCETALVLRNIGCMKGYILERKLEEIVLSSIKKHVEIFDLKNVELFKDKNHSGNKLGEFGSLEKIKNLENEIKKLNMKKMDYYQKYQDGKISKVDFVKEKDFISQLIFKWEREIDGFRGESFKSNSENELQERVGNIRCLGDIEKLSKDVVDNFLEKILVYDVDRVEVVWKFGDFFQYDIVR